MSRFEKISVLDFGCGSMNVCRKLNKHSFIKHIVGTDIFYFKLKSKKMQYIQSDKFFETNNRSFYLVIAIDVLHHIGIDQAAKILGDMAAVYFVSVAAIVAAFFGAQAMQTKPKK